MYHTGIVLIIVLREFVKQRIDSPVERRGVAAGNDQALPDVAESVELARTLAGLVELEHGLSRAEHPAHHVGGLDLRAVRVLEPTTNGRLAVDIGDARAHQAPQLLRMLRDPSDLREPVGGIAFD